MYNNSQISISFNIYFGNIVIILLILLVTYILELYITIFLVFKILSIRIRLEIL